MKNLLIKIALAIGVTGCLYVVALLTTTDHYWCFKDRDTCTIEEIEYWRGLKEQTNNEITNKYNEQLASSNDYFDNKKINPLKLTLSASALIKEAKEGDKRNLPQELFSLKNSLVPIAHADNGDGWNKDVEIKDQDSITTAQGNKKPLRYQALLTSVGSPYADVDIESSCEKAGVTQKQCDILVAISGAESSFGTKYRKKDLSTGSIVVADEEGKSKHNPVGMKGGGLSYPTEDGFYLRPFASWEDFWAQYPVIMKRGYFDRGGNTPAEISKCYVSGDCVSVKYSWVYRVESFINKI